MARQVLHVTARSGLTDWYVRKMPMSVLLAHVLMAEPALRHRSTLQLVEPSLWHLTTHASVLKVSRVKIVMLTSTSANRLRAIMALNASKGSSNVVIRWHGSRVSVLMGWLAIFVREILTNVSLLRV